jgi:Domain of unknown function (DUF4135)
MLCLFTVLGGIDFHAENVVAHENIPYPVDVEALFHPWQPPLAAALSNETATAFAAASLKRSVIATYYLPSWILRPDEVLIRSLSPNSLRPRRSINHTSAASCALSLLAPDIVEGALNATLPAEFTLERAMKPLPLIWEDQRRAVRPRVVHRTR